jgi:signal transduction histidine kinase/DNA-binding response OmpR family regulator
MKIALLLVTTLALVTDAAAQYPAASTYKADSLKNLIQQSAGIHKAIHLFELAKVNTELDLDSAKSEFEQALAICRELKADTTIMKIIAGFQYPLCRVGQRELAKHYLILARDMNTPGALDPKFRGLIYRALFRIHMWYYSMYDSSVHYGLLEVALPGDSITNADRYLNVAWAYNELGDNLKALEYYNIARTYLTGTNEDPWYLSYLYNGMGMLYADERDTKKSEDYYLKAVAYGKASGYPTAALSPMNNLAVHFDWMGQYDRALKYLDSVAALLPIENDPWAWANNTFNRGNTLSNMGRPAEGMELIKKAMAMFAKLKDDATVARLHLQLAQPNRMLGDYRTAEREALIALAWDRTAGYGELTKESYKALSEIYSASGQFEKAFDYQSRYLKIIDSLNSAERRTQFGMVEKNYEITRQQKIREKLVRENELHLAQAQADRTLRVALIAGTIVLSLAAIYTLVAYRRMRSQNTVLNQQKLRIEEQAQQLHEAAKTKARFFANVSHELRTPVTLLNGMLELMKEQPARNGTDEKLSVALGSSRRLQGMLNEVLDLSRVEAGRWQLATKPRELLPLLNRIVLAFESLFVRKNLKLEYDASSTESVVIDVDEDKFEKVINNLIYNAIKFNRAGGWVRVTAHPTETFVVIQVADSGIGIPEKELPFIFDRFYQSASAEKLTSQGIGIGLSLVREFTELHGGNVAVSSQLNEGSCFTVHLPLTSTVEWPVEINDDNPALPEISFEFFTRQPHLLIVEDNDEMRFYIKEILGDHVTISEAQHGREGLKWLKNNTPDLIISDVMMPEMDGYEFLAQLKNSSTLRGIPVVMLTARAAEDDLLHGLSLGVDDYIIKPFNSKELRIRIHNLLTNQEIRRVWIQKPIETGEMVVPSVPSEDQVFIAKVQAFVEENAGNATLGIAELGDHLAMSERQVYRKAATLTGMTPAQLIKEIRMKIAYRLLLQRGVVKVADLARRVGFENTSYFSRQFQERFGKRPAEFL